MTEPDPETLSDRAAEVLAGFLAEIEAGREPDLEALCAAHPEIAVELRRAHATWQRVAGVLPGARAPGVVERVRGLVAASTDRAAQSAWQSVLDRLEARARSASRYATKGRLGAGGMGEVLEVWDQDLKRDVAMKVIRGEVADSPQRLERAVGRFLDEAQVTGQLDHPGIVPVHELGIDERGQLYFTMKRVRGRTLREVFADVREQRDDWTITRALGVLSKICDAVAFAHSKGVVHRDLKPDNIMTGRFGEAYVMDWGLARVMDRPERTDVEIVDGALRSADDVELARDRAAVAGDDPSSPLLTRDGDVVGTAAYMSPEQALGDLDRIGPASDVYSMGAILYELLAGARPYYTTDAVLSNLELLHRVRSGPPTPLAKHAAGVPAELASICEMAMARRNVAQRLTDGDAVNPR